MKSEKVPISGLEGGGAVATGPSVQFCGVPESPPPAWGPLAVHPPAALGLPWQRGSRDSAAGPALAPLTAAPKGGAARPETPARVGVAARPPALPRALAFRLPETGPAGRGPAEPRRRSGNASPRPRSAGARGAAWRGRVRAARRRPPRSRAPGVACGPGRRLGRPAGEPTHDALARGRRQRSPRRSPVPARPRAPHGLLLHFTEWRSGLKHPQHSGSVHSGNTQPSTKLLGRL